MQNHLAKQLLTFSKKQEAKIKPTTEGFETGDWIVVDINGIYVHILRSEVREYYKIENFGKIIYQKIQKISKI